MTMTREEQIRKKAKELGQQYFPDSSNIWARSNVEACYVENACVEMAEWVDQHPNWISVEEELPKEKQKVLVYMPADERCDHEYICEALYNYAWHGWEDADEPIELEGITHWMEIQPPRKEE